MRSAKTRIGVVSALLLMAAWAGPATGGTVYSIQVAAATDKGAAEERAEEMNRLGYHAYVRLETVPGKGDWYRVYVERFGSRAEADREAASLKSLGLLQECFVRPVGEEAEKAQPRRKGEVAAPSRARKEAAAPAPGGVAKPSAQKQPGGGAARLHFVQVGSFKEKENARKYAASLEKTGQKPFFVEEGEGRERWYKVYIGEFADVQAARNAGNELKERGVLSYYKVIGFDRGRHPRAANPGTASTPPKLKRNTVE